MIDKRCIHALISGKVQGVFFRVSTQQEAQRLNVNGWVCNTTDNKVELKACGNRENIASFIDWLHNGPELAEVADVQVQEIALESFSHFIIK